MPTSHGSLPFKGRRAGRGRLGPRGPAAGRGRGAGRQDRGARVRHAQLHQDQGLGHRPAARGTTTRTPGGSSGGSAAAVAAGLVPWRRPATAAGSTRIPAAFAGLVGMKPSHGRIPHPGPQRQPDLGLRPAHHDRRRLGPPPRRGRRAATSGTACRCPRPRVGYEAAIEALDVAGLRARWSPDLGFATVDPRGRCDLAGAAARELATAAGLALDDEPVAPARRGARLARRRGHGHLARPRAGHVARRGRRPHRSTPASAWSRPRTGRSPEFANVMRRRRGPRRATGRRPLRRGRRAAHARRRPSRRSPPRARRRATVDGEEVVGAMTTPFTMLANLCWNPAISVPAGPHRRGPARRPADRGPPPPRRDPAAPGPHPRADPALAALLAPRPDPRPRGRAGHDPRPAPGRPAGRPGRRGRAGRGTRTGTRSTSRRSTRTAPRSASPPSSSGRALVVPACSPHASSGGWPWPPTARAQGSATALLAAGLERCRTDDVAVVWAHARELRGRPGTRTEACAAEGEGYAPGAMETSRTALVVLDLG